MCAIGGEGCAEALLLRVGSGWSDVFAYCKGGQNVYEIGSLRIRWVAGRTIWIGIGYALVLNF